MQVIKVRDLSSGRYYFTRVDDDDRRRDPLNQFDKLKNHGGGKMSNIDREVISRNLSQARSVSEVVTNRIKAKGDPLFIDTSVVTPVKKKPATKSTPKVVESKVEVKTDEVEVSTKSKTRTKRKRNAPTEDN